ncbi:MAG: CotH kinase family protein [Verrucomicrobia bacterium]|jgi:spore coat protein CotH|nr:CotH kinase family protein [Verrucomicrobiota bacterium]
MNIYDHGYLRLRFYHLLSISLSAVALTLLGMQTCGQVNSKKNVGLENSETTLLNSFYASGQIQEIHLSMEPAQLDRLKHALPERIYVPATFRWRNVTLAHVGIRYKGNSSSHPDQKHKRSFLIKFNEFEKGQRFLGLRRVALDNGVQFGSLFSECLITDILRDQGIHASRSNYAKLLLNGNYLGIYVNVERLDQSFLKHHFSTQEGLLYKVDLGGRGSNLQFIGKDTALYADTFEAKSDQAENGRISLVDFIQMINQLPEHQFETLIEESMEWEAFLRTTATMLFSGAFDQLTGWNPHNYYLYFQPESRQWHYLPWDLDVGFADKAFGKIPVIDGWHAAWPVPGGPPRPLLERIVRHPEILKRYRELADEILEEYFRPEVLISKLDALYALIREDLSKDSFPHRRITNPSDTSYDDIVDSIKAFIQRRYETARVQLDHPGVRPDPPEVPRQPQEQPRPGTRKDGVPTGLRIDSVSASGVSLAWTDNATGEVGHIVQRSSGEQEKHFANLIGQPGDHIQFAEDFHVRSGQTFSYRVYALFAAPLGPEGTVPSEVVTVTIPR